MSVKPTLLIIGPGLIGGSLLTEFLRTDQYALTVMARSAEQIAVLSQLGVKTIQAGLQDLDIIASAVEAHDITINAASADDVPVAEASINALGRNPKNAAGGQKIYIQISGAGVFGHRFSPHNSIDTIYDDSDPEIINSLSPTAPHREVDLAWHNASQELAGKVKIAIFIPATVFGIGSGPFRKVSIQIPIKIQAALKDGYASYGRDGQATFAHISISDLVTASTILLDALQNDKVDVTKNPYFNANNSVETKWLDVAKRIGSDLYARGKIPTAEARSSGSEWDFYGVYRPRTTRLRALGWKETDVDVLGGVSADVEALTSA
ncbi:hypothetical protein DFH07DRAFT_793179 [Mycena maculata]|uniref:NAD-dependent epimerase/dehydratase domain-containing protein n=1 Tax=Mycena maculata TaxID=230809 RepID=A0AAD7KAT4_9AGAR|nr:hypothetical protein DFH07DRAFT_793179 [Mycena maculata]